MSEHEDSKRVVRRCFNCGKSWLLCAKGFKKIDKSGIATSEFANPVYRLSLVFPFYEDTVHVCSAACLEIVVSDHVGRDRAWGKEDDEEDVVYKLTSKAYDDLPQDNEKQ